MSQPRISDKSMTHHILKSFNLHAIKRFGQNFLIDEEVIQKIIETSDISKGEEILEIGPGIGTLTQALLESSAKVTAIEIDKKLSTVLAETLSGYEGFRLINGDVLKFDLTKIMSKNFKVVANLPYYITTQILLTLLEKNLSISKIVTMIQKEVAERVVASPNSKIYGALSIAAQIYSRPKIVLEVPPSSFIPSPKVKSAVVVFDILKSTFKTCDKKILRKVIHAAFSQRRKTLINSLRSLEVESDKILSALRDSEIDGRKRAENLSVREFVNLSNCLTWYMK